MSLSLPFPDELVEAVARRTAEIVVERLGPSQVSPWLDVDGAAAYLSTTPQALRAMVKRRQLQPVRRKPRLLFARADLDAWARDES